MRLAFKVWNDQLAELEVHVEPWCYPYFVPHGSTLTFHYDVDAASDAIGEVEVRRGDWLAVWFESEGPPTAQLDGQPVEPMWR